MPALRAQIYLGPVGKVDLKLGWCSYPAARHAVIRWHYSHRMPVGKIVRVGAWEDGRFIGCVIFGRGATNSIGKPYGLSQTQICELVRVALDQHATPTSRIVAIALKLLRQRCPGLRLIVSYADSGQGHHGGIYQAGGWIHTGESRAVSIRLHGQICHARSVGMKYGTHRMAWLRQHVDSQAAPVADSAKYKYLMPLDAEMRKQVHALAKPYPKRAGSETGDTSAFQAEEGGPIPTPALPQSCNKNEVLS